MASAQTFKMTTPFAPGVAVPDKLESSIGTLNLNYGYPTAETVEKIYDNLDRSRALQAYLLAIPIVNQAGMRDSIRKFGPDNQTDVIWEDLVDPRTVELTANDNTIYNFIWVDTSKGPLVAEIPPKVLGLVNDFWYKWVADVGITGADQGAGGKYLLLPPGYKGEIPPGYHVVRPSTFGNWLVFRAFLVDGSTKPGVESVKKNLRIYRLADAANPPPMKFVNASGVPANFVAPGDYSFWGLLNQVIQEEPPEGSDPTTLGLFASIGIVKGQPFNPDERMKKILTDAANIGAVTARTHRLQDPLEGSLLLSRQRVAAALLRRLQVRGVARRQQPGRRGLLLLLRHRRHAGDGGEDGGPGLAVPLVGAGFEGQPLRRRQDLQAAPAAERPGQGLLVGDRLRQPDALDGADRPEGAQRQQPGQGRQDQCGRLGGCLLRAQGAGGHGEQLGADDSGQGLVHDPAPVRTAGTVVQQDLAAGRDRTAAVARQWRACLGRSTSGPRYGSRGRRRCAAAKPGP